MSSHTSHRNMDPQILSVRRLREPTTGLPGKPEAQTLHHKYPLNCHSDSRRDAVTSHDNDSKLAREGVRKTSVETSQHVPTPGAGKPGVLKSVFSYRCLMVLLMHGSFVVTSIQRDCTSMAIVCMFDEESSSLNSSASINSSSVDYANEIKPNVPDWDSNMRGLVISAATFTSFLSPFVSQFLSRHFGGKRTMTLIMGTGCLLLFLSPIAARTDPYLMIAVRIVVGITYGGNIPILSEFTGWWAPSNEKLTMSSVIYTGFNTAGVLLFFTSGYVCSIPVDGGWPFIYYTNGFISLIWLVLWVTLSARRPEDHPFISEKEKQYIIENRPARRERSRDDEGKTPYFTILKSPPVIAIIICASGHMWTLTLLLSFAPVYLNEAIHYSVEETGVIMSVVSAARFLAAALFTCFGNWMTHKTSVTTSRKAVLCIGYGLAAASSFALAVVQYYNRFAVVVLLMLIFCLQIGGTGTLSVNPIDLAPRYASFISTVWFSVSALTAITAPLLTTFLTSEGSLEGWRTLWYLSGAIFTVLVITFLVFGDAKLQQWAREPTNVTSARSISISVDRDTTTNPDTVSDSNDMWIPNCLTTNGNNSYDGGIDNPRFEMESYPGNIIIPNYDNENSSASRTNTQKIQIATSNGFRPHNHWDVSNPTRH